MPMKMTPLPGEANLLATNEELNNNQGANPEVQASPVVQQLGIEGSTVVVLRNNTHSKHKQGQEIGAGRLFQEVGRMPPHLT